MKTTTKKKKQKKLCHLNLNFLPVREASIEQLRDVVAHLHDVYETDKEMHHFLAQILQYGLGFTKTKSLDWAKTLLKTFPNFNNLRRKMMHLLVEKTSKRPVPPYQIYLVYDSDHDEPLVTITGIVPDDYGARKPFLQELEATSPFSWIGFVVGGLHVDRGYRNQDVELLATCFCLETIQEFVNKTGQPGMVYAFLTDEIANTDEFLDFLVFTYPNSRQNSSTGKHVFWRELFPGESRFPMLHLR